MSEQKVANGQKQIVIGEKVQAIIVSWQKHKTSGLYNGFARILKSDGEGDRSKPSLFLLEKHVRTTGIDTIVPGKTVIEAEVGPIYNGHTSPVAYNIKIFMD